MFKLLLILLLVLGCSPTEQETIHGCTIESACNYDSEATTYDASCLWPLNQECSCDDVANSITDCDEYFSFDPSTWDGESGIIVESADITGSWQRDLPATDIWPETTGIMLLNEDNTISFEVVGEEGIILGIYSLDSGMLTITDDRCSTGEDWENIYSNDDIFQNYLIYGTYGYMISELGDIISEEPLELTERELTLILVNDECQYRDSFLSNQSTAVWTKIE